MHLAWPSIIISSSQVATFILESSAPSPSPSISRYEFPSFPFTSSYLAGQDSTIARQTGHGFPRNTLQMTSATIVQPTSAKAHSYAYALIVEISVGTPAQTPFQILLDTGSYEFWLRSTYCTSKSTCIDQPRFDPSKSSSFISTHSPSSSQTLVYGDGSKVNCSINIDTIQISTLTLLSQQICLATQISTNSVYLDGVIGFGPPGNAFEGKADVLGTIKSQNPRLSKLVTFWYNNTLDSSSTSGNSLYRDSGVVTIGGIDETLYIGSMTYFKISTSRYWTLSVAKIATSTGNILASLDGAQLIIDTGTSFFLVPDGLFSTLSTFIGAKYDSELGIYMLDCTKIGEIPAIVIYFEAASRDYLVLGGNQLSVYDSGFCVSAIQPAGDSSTFIFGAAVLKNFYSVFDGESGRVGFAASYGAVHPNVSVVNVQEREGAETTILGVGVLTFIEIVAGVAAGGIGVGLVVQLCIRKRMQKNARITPITHQNTRLFFKSNHPDSQIQHMYRYHTQTDLSLFINQNGPPGPGHLYTHSSQGTGYPANFTVGIPLPAVTETGVPVMIYQQEPLDTIDVESLESIEF